MCPSSPDRTSPVAKGYLEIVIHRLGQGSIDLIARRADEIRREYGLLEKLPEPVA